MAPQDKNRSEKNVGSDQNRMHAQGNRDADVQHKGAKQDDQAKETDDALSADDLTRDQQSTGKVSDRSPQRDAGHKEKEMHV